MHAFLRIVDANANRAREGLRVLEDLARFALADSGLTERSKALRHDVALTVGALAPDPSALLAARDTESDVGTEIAGAAEGRRPAPADLCAANANRAAEALRVLEETAKLLARADLGARFERARYTLYTFHRDLAAALGPWGAGAAANPAAAWRVCVLLTESLCRNPWRDVAEAIVHRAASDPARGADAIQLREKSLPDRELLARARWLVAASRAAAGDAGPRGRTAIIVNDRPDIALLAGADGVHLGQDDLHPQDVRRLAGRGLLVGVSTHSMDEARAAAAAGADVCGVGAMFPTGTKPRETSGPAYLRAYLADPATARIPHLAIGGITPENLPTLAAAGCRAVAVSAAVCGAADPAGACARLHGALRSGAAPIPAAE